MVLSGILQVKDFKFLIKRGVLQTRDFKLILKKRDLKEKKYLKFLIKVGFHKKGFKVPQERKQWGLVGGHIFFEYYFEKSILNHQNSWGSSIFEGYHKIKKKRKNRFWIFKKGFLNKKRGK